MCPPSNSPGSGAELKAADIEQGATAAATATRRRRSSLRMSLTQSVQDELAQQLAFAEQPWPWSMFSGFSTDKAKTITLLGCLSSTIVLVVRLFLDHSPPAYLIHSIIVFFDMILIHMFTHSTWLSVTGEIITYVFFLSFHFTKETVWELLETTLLAIISSFYMIASRKQVMQQRDGLEDDIQSLRRRGALLLRNIAQVHAAIREKEKEGLDPNSSVMLQVEGEQEKLASMRSLNTGNPQRDDLIAREMKEGLRGDSLVEDSDTDEDEETTSDQNSNHPTEIDTELTRELLKQGECSCSVRTFTGRLNKWLAPFKKDPEVCKSRMKCYRTLFFEYFLDGAAGVMYTSFLGLIIDALLNYGGSKY